MSGTSSACSPESTWGPESTPGVWLCFEPDAGELPCPGWLTDHERTTVAQFSGPRRREFLCSRWLLRQAIAHQSGCPATDCAPVQGRPVASLQPPGWHLSLSHSLGLSGCAVNAGPGLGLDIEPLARPLQWQKVVKRWFTTSEQAWLLARNSQTDFLRVWTLKEAWLKATGRGIAGNLQTLEVSPDFQLLGDLGDTHWQAASSITGGYLVTLVYRQPTSDAPTGHMLQDTPASLDLNGQPPQAEPVTFTWQRPVAPRPGHSEEP